MNNTHKLPEPVSSERFEMLLAEEERRQAEDQQKMTPEEWADKYESGSEEPVA